MFHCSLLSELIFIFTCFFAGFFSKAEDNHILSRFQPKSVWYLTMLGSLATTQREYVALHAFRRLSLQVRYFSQYIDMFCVFNICLVTTIDASYDNTDAKCYSET